jgi:HlyD family secretion protein
MRIRPKKLIVPAVLVVVGGLIAWSVSSRSVEVDVGRVRRGDVRDFVEEEARTRVVDRYVLGSHVAGRLLRVTVREGDAVEKGDVLARVDPLALSTRVTQTRAKLRELRARLEGVDRRRPKAEEVSRAALRVTLAEEEVAVARRSFEESKATLAKAKRDADRARELSETGTITPDELEAEELVETQASEDRSVRERRVRIAELVLEVARLESSILLAKKGDYDWEEEAYREQITAAEAALEVQRDDLTRADVIAPADGVVLRRHLESEAVVAAGTPILEVGDIRRLEVVADLLSEDAARMEVGQPVEVYGRALHGATLPGRITRIHPGAFRKISSLGVEQQRVTVVAEFDPGEHALGDEYRVHLRVIFATSEDTILVPEGALFRHGDSWSVFRVEGDRLRRVGVRIGLGDGRVREVREGLQPGDEVVLHPEAGLEEGARITRRNG